MAKRTKARGAAPASSASSPIDHEIEMAIDHEIEMAVAGPDPHEPSTADEGAQSPAEASTSEPATSEPTTSEDTSQSPAEASTSDEPSDRGARRRRLARAGFEVDRCELLGRLLDAGPRAPRWSQPTSVSLATGEACTFSLLAAALLDAAVTPEELERAADWLRERGR